MMIKRKNNKSCQAEAWRICRPQILVGSFALFLFWRISQTQGTDERVDTIMANGQKRLLSSSLPAGYRGNKRHITRGLQYDEGMNMKIKKFFEGESTGDNSGNVETTNAEQLSRRSPMQFPEQSPHQFPEQNPHQFPEQSQHQFPEQSQHQFPEQSQHQFPVQNQHQFPEQSQHQFPVQSSHQFSEQSQHQFPVQSQQQFPVQSPHQFPVQSQQQFPVQSQQQFPRQSAELKYTSADYNTANEGYGYPPDYEGIMDDEAKERQSSPKVGRNRLDGFGRLKNGESMKRLRNREGVFSNSGRGKKNEETTISLDEEEGRKQRSREKGGITGGGPLDRVRSNDGLQVMHEKRTRNDGEPQTPREAKKWQKQMTRKDNERKNRMESRLE